MKELPVKDVPNCRSCGRTLVNRLVDYCLFCEADLPLHLRLSREEKKALSEELSDLRKKQMEDAERRRTELDRITDLGGGTGGFDLGD